MIHSDILNEFRLTVTSDSSHKYCKEIERNTLFTTICCLYVTGSLVWAGITYNGKTRLHIFGRGSVTSQRYCREIIPDHVRFFREVVDRDILFMENNVRRYSNAEVSNT